MHAVYCVYAVYTTLHITQTAVVRCDDPPDAPGNGIRNYSDTTFGSIVTYTCNPNYRLTGFNKIECMANGQWSGNAPECSGKLLCNKH